MVAKNMTHVSWWASALSFCVLLVGCGSEGTGVVAVKGRITNRGEAIQVNGLEIGLGRVAVELYPLKPDGKPLEDPFTASCDASGNFDVAGIDGSGIPVGQYMVAIRAWDPEPQVDRLNGQYAFGKSELTQTIDGKADIMIDLDADLSP